MSSYEYVDAEGNPLHRVVKKDNTKEFYQQHWNGSKWEKGLNGEETVPYNLPLVLETAELGEKPIWILEGEKDCDNARDAYGIVATTNSGGAGKWWDHHSRWLAQAGAERVIICYDNDEKGWAHTWQVHDSLRKYGIPDVYFRRALEGKDISDHINAGRQLNELVRKKPPRLKPAIKVRDSSSSDAIDGFLPAAFQAALQKLRDRGPVSLEDPDEHQYNTR